MSEFTIRFISSLILIPFVIVIVWAGSYWFIGFVAIITIIVGYEWMNLFLYGVFFSTK